MIYEMHIGSFYRPDGNHVGTLELAMERFDHLGALGVDLIQLMPVAEFAGDFSWATTRRTSSPWSPPTAAPTRSRPLCEKRIGVE